MLKSQQTTLRPLALAISSIALSMGLSGAVQAQGSMALEEIIVTAQKRLETAQETPLSITAFSATAIENRGIQNTEDLIGQIPGVGGFSAPGSRGAVGLNIRGVSSGSPANLSLDPAVAMYLDGVYVGKLVGSAMDVAEIERIETLRGPQGTLYGRNSTAGALNIITKKPTGEFGFRATATAGNYDLWGVKANMDLPAIGTVGEGAGRLAANLGYQIRKRGALYENVVPGQHDFDTLDREAWRVSLNWTPVESLSIDYTYDHSELDENGTLQRVVGLTPLDASGTDRLGMLKNLRGAVAAPGADPRWAESLERTIAQYEAVEAKGAGRRSKGASDFSPYMDNKLDGHALTIAWEAGELGALGDVTFKSITAHRKLETYVYGDLEDLATQMDANGVGALPDLIYLTTAQYGGFASPMAGFMLDLIDTYGSYHSKQDTTSRYEQFSQEFQMIGATERLDYALGLYWFEDESKYDRYAIWTVPLADMGHQHYKTTTEALAVFGQGTWRPPSAVLNDRLSLTAGLRYTEETKDIRYDYWTTGSPLAPGFSPVATHVPTLKRKKNFYNLSGTFTAAWEVTADINTYLRYSTGYRSGGFNGEIYDNAFDEETIEQWEVGFKSDWWDRRLRINGALYTYTYEDMQVSQILADGGQVSSKITNAGEAKRWGGELEVMVAPIADLIVSLSYSYTDGDFEKFPDTCNADQSICLPSSNAARRSSPSNQINFAADYVFARTNIGDFTGHLGVNWQDHWYESGLWTEVIGANPATGNPGTPVIHPHLKMDERTVVNARFSLENIRVGDGTLKFSLWGKNLTNDDYPTFGINFGGMGLIAEQYGDPRTYGLDVTYEY